MEEFIITYDEDWIYLNNKKVIVTSDPKMVKGGWKYTMKYIEDGSKGDKV